MVKTLYLDHQASTPVDQEVLDAMQPFWSVNFGNPHSSEHIVGWKANAEISKAKQNVATFLGANPDEIFFTSGATESNNLAAYSLCELSRLYPKKKQILVSPIEHKCIINAILHWAPNFDLNVKFLKVDQHGYVDLGGLRQDLKTPTLFCSIGYVNNEIGTIQPMSELSKLLREADCLFHSDIAQAPKTISCYSLADYGDLLSLSGHKIGAPQGIGAIFIAGSLQEKLTPLMHGGGQQNGIRSGTLPLPLCVGLAKACELLNGSEAQIRRDVTAKLRNYFWAAIQNLDISAQLNGPTLADRHVGNLNVSLDGFAASEVLMLLQPEVCASTGSACSSGSIEGSHVLSAIGLNEDRSSSAIRFSFSHCMSYEELDEAIEHLGRCLNKIKSQE